MQSIENTNRFHGVYAYRALQNTMAGKATLALLASVFVALCAHVSVRLPFTPVPLTLGNMAVVLVGLALGPVTAFSAILLYLIEGAAGLPVFNPGGPGGVAQLLGPTGGFLMAYPFAAALSGLTLRVLSRSLSRFAAAALAATLGTLLILTLGAAWLATLLHLTPALATTLGVTPFLPGEVIKVLAAAGIFTSLQRWNRA